jgi:putative ABC transport system substrate-binding protein
MEFDQAFVRGLHEFGYVDGQNLRIEYRWGDGTEAPLLARMREIVELQPDVIVVAGSPGVRAAMNATASIPIVMASSPDAVRDGLVASLTRPGGNVTGLSMFVPEMAGKRLELLKELIPDLKRIATIWNAGNPGNVPLINDVRTAAQRMGLGFYSAGVRQVADLEVAFASIVSERIDALNVLSDGFMATNRRIVLALAAQNRLPAVYPSDIYVDDGGLISYGPSIAAAYHRAAHFVSRILKGARPADLPVEQPMKFELAVNLKTAKALGLKIPQPILLRADRTIE